MSDKMEKLAGKILKMAQEIESQSFESESMNRYNQGRIDALMAALAEIRSLDEGDYNK